MEFVNHTSTTSRRLVLIACLFLCLTSAAAGAQAREGWYVINGPDGDFTVEFPSLPTSEITVSEQLPFTGRKMFFYSYKVDEAYMFTFNYKDLPARAASTDRQQVLTEYERGLFLDAWSVVGTWYKVRVSETLSQKPPYQCSECGPVTLPDPPADLLPLNADEILIYRGGGTVEVGAVTFHYEVEQFPEFNITQKYLFFLTYDSSKKVALASVGPTGVFVVASPDLLNSTLTDADGLVISNAVTDGMSTRFGNHLTQLRNFFNPPQSCDPTGSLWASCVDNGGTWNPTTCYCRPAFDPCTRKPWLCE